MVSKPDIERIKDAFMQAISKHREKLDQEILEIIMSRPIGENMPTLAELMNEYETVERPNCKDCGNPWFFSMPHNYLCTTCGTGRPRTAMDIYEPKPKCIGLDKVHVDGNCPAHKHGFTRPK